MKRNKLTRCCLLLSLLLLIYFLELTVHASETNLTTPVKNDTWSIRADTYPRDPNAFPPTPGLKLFIENGNSKNLITQSIDKLGEFRDIKLYNSFLAVGGFHTAEFNFIFKLDKSSIDRVLKFKAYATSTKFSPNNRFLTYTEFRPPRNPQAQKAGTYLVFLIDFQNFIEGESYYPSVRDKGFPIFPLTNFQNLTMKRDWGDGDYDFDIDEYANNHVYQWHESKDLLGFFTFGENNHVWQAYLYDFRDGLRGLSIKRKSFQYLSEDGSETNPHNLPTTQWLPDQVQVGNNYLKLQRKVYPHKKVHTKKIKFTDMNQVASWPPEALQKNEKK